MSSFGTVHKKVVPALNLHNLVYVSFFSNEKCYYCLAMVARKFLRSFLCLLKLISYVNEDVKNNKNKKTKNFCSKVR